jgi:hypothetical protein
VPIWASVAQSYKHLHEHPPSSINYIYVVLNTNPERELRKLGEKITAYKDWKRKLRLAATIAPVHGKRMKLLKTNFLRSSPITWLLSHLLLAVVLTTVSQTDFFFLSLFFFY